MSSAPVAFDAGSTLPTPRFSSLISDFYELSKPRIIFLLLITTYAAMVMAQRGFPPFFTTLWTLVGGSLAAASAGAFNCVIDRDIDGLMRRTMNRPLPTGRMSAMTAVIFASVVCVLSFSILFFLVNPLAAMLSLAGNAYYVLIYTMWLKRTTPLNIVIGGAAGAVPPLVGWASITHSLGLPAIGLFAIIFLWTPPHFWALALMTETDYHKANIPMLPNVAGVMRTKIEIVAYTLVLLIFSLALYPLHIMGLLYFVSAALLGGIFLFDAVAMLRHEDRIWPRRTFSYSLLYLALICVAMVADRILLAWKTAKLHSGSPTSTQTIAGHKLDKGTLALLFTLGLGVFAGALDLGVLSPALPAIATLFQVTPHDASLIVSVYLLANIACIPIATKLADRYGRQSVYIACVAIFGLGSVLTIIAPNFFIFLLARAIQAAGAGGIFPVATAAIADRVPQERRGAALGILGAIWGLAGILGPILGGILTHLISWRAVFIANIPLSVIVIFMAQTHVPKLAPGKRGALDIAGIALLTIALIGIVVGLTRIDPQTAALGNQITTIVALTISLIALIALHFVERRAAEPVISPALMANKQIAITYGLELLIGALEGALFFVPAALVAGQHMGASLAGLIAAVGALFFVGVIPLAGRALDRIGARAVLAIGTLVTGSGLALFAVSYHSLWLSIASMVIAGSGFGALLGAPTRYIISNEAPTANRSSAIGLLSIFLIIGQVVGSSLAGGLVSGSDIIGGSYKLAYLSFAALAVVAFGVSLLLAPHRKIAV